MKQRKVVLGWIACWSAVLMLMTLIIPGIVVKPMDSAPPAEAWLNGIQLKPDVELETALNEPAIPVYLTQAKRIETVPLEAYVRGVIAAEMPIEFELEALKAQAIAARTYIVRRLMYEDTSNVPVEGALVTDTITHQAYLNTSQLRSRWSVLDYAKNIEKLNRAVNETAGLIATYEGEPIQAVFFSTSNGHTENSEDYFRDAIPYLRSVPSPWDSELSPKYEQSTAIPLKEMMSKLGLSAPVSTSGGKLQLQVVEETAGKRISSIKVADQLFTGREVREKLGLPSSHFTWKLDKDHIIFTTYGYGHGVGMSQWGANGMAKEGKDAAEIIRYYYQGVNLEKWPKDKLAGGHDGGGQPYGGPDNPSKPL